MQLAVAAYNRKAGKKGLELYSYDSYLMNTLVSTLKTCTVHIARGGPINKQIKQNNTKVLYFLRKTFSFH